MQHFELHSLKIILRPIFMQITCVALHPSHQTSQPSHTRQRPRKCKDVHHNSETGTQTQQTHQESQRLNVTYHGVTTTNFFLSLPPPQSTVSAPPQSPTFKLLIDLSMPTRMISPCPVEPDVVEEVIELRLVGVKGAVVEREPAAVGIAILVGVDGKDLLLRGTLVCFGMLLVCI